MSKWISIALALFFLACSTTPSKLANQRSLSSAQCTADPDYPPLFNVIENNQSQIVVELGAFTKFFKMSGDSYQYKVMFKGSKENKDDKEQVIEQKTVQGDSNRVTVKVAKTGVYYFTIFQKESSPVWKQKVFAIAAGEHKLTDSEREELARKYAPIVRYHDQEKYFPVSLPYLMNQADADPQLKTEPFLLTNKKLPASLGSFFSFGGSKDTLNVSMNFEKVPSILPYYGHAESVLKSGLDKSSDTRMALRYGKDHATIYYSVFENPKYGEIYINYHFFYTYDPKNSTEEKAAMAAHILDRESMTVVLNKSRTPIDVFYAAHLTNQFMGKLGANKKPTQIWKTGRVHVNWRDLTPAYKFKDRPMPAIALGSHGIYPETGTYAVLLNDSKTSPTILLEEPAGGNKILYPEFATDYEKTATSYPYKLENLKLDGVTSDCANPNSILAFSGSTVDVLGPVNATFPPFTDREEDYFSYADPNAPLFELEKPASR